MSTRSRKKKENPMMSNFNKRIKGLSKLILVAVIKKIIDLIFDIFLD